MVAGDPRLGHHDHLIWGRQGRSPSARRALLTPADLQAIVLAQGVGDALPLGSLARLLLTAAGIVSAVTVVSNPWGLDRVSDQVPAIMQDVVIAVVMLIREECPA